jgi:glutamine synthetase
VAQSLSKAGHPLFAGEGTYGDLSQTARWYLGGLLRHGPSLAAFTNPGTNSYRRLGSGPQAPTRLAYARHDSVTVVAVPEPDSDPGRRRLVLRQGDGLANPYLAFSAMLLAGLDGVRHQIDPGPPADREPAPSPARLPTDLGAARAALAADHDYLLAGDVFGRDAADDRLLHGHAHLVLCGPARLEHGLVLVHRHGTGQIQVLRQTELLVWRVLGVGQHRVVSGPAATHEQLSQHGWWCL